MAAPVTKPDLAALKTEIQNLNYSWASASNTKDITTILGFYADDAISLPDDKPPITGKDANIGQQ